MQAHKNKAIIKFVKKIMGHDGGSGPGMPAPAWDMARLGPSTGQAWARTEARIMRAGYANGTRMEHRWHAESKKMEREGNADPIDYNISSIHKGPSEIVLTTMLTDSSRWRTAARSTGRVV